MQHEIQPTCTRANGFLAKMHAIRNPGSHNNTKNHMMKRLFLFLAITSFLGLTGCLRNGSDTIALPFGKIPDGVIPEPIKEQFMNHMPIYEGITPPVVTGEYLCKPDELVYTSDNQFNVGYVFAPCYFAFMNQTASGMATFREKQASLVGDASEVYIVGSGTNFSAYYISHETHYDDNNAVEATVTRSNVLSGTLTPNGIRNYYLAFIVLDKYDPNNIIMDVNEYRIFKDGDGVAERYDWRTSKNLQEIQETLPSFTDAKPITK